MYLKTWSGTVTEGRNAGYPEMKFAVFASLIDLAKDQTRKEEVIYEVKKANPESIKVLIADCLKKQKELEEQEVRAKEEAEFERLKNKLGK